MMQNEIYPVRLLDKITESSLPKYFSPKILVWNYSNTDPVFGKSSSLRKNEIDEFHFPHFSKWTEQSRQPLENIRLTEHLIPKTTSVRYGFGIALNDDQNCVLNNEPTASPLQYTGEFRKKINLTEKRSNDSNNSKRKCYSCPYCPVTCSNRGQLHGHIRIHTGERPYVCTEPGCSRTFIRNEELTRHRRIHTGERPHTCSFCEKTFSRKDHLNKHRRVHITDKHAASSDT